MNCLALIGMAFPALVALSSAPPAEPPARFTRGEGLVKTLEERLPAKKAAR